jgi:hypothetical protein
MINKVRSFSLKTLKNRKMQFIHKGKLLGGPSCVNSPTAEKFTILTRDVFEQIVHAQFLQPLHSNICSMEKIPGVYMETG